MTTISYKLRIDMENIQPILTTVLRDIEDYSYCQEVGPNGQNPHIHIYLRTTLKSDTLRKRVKKLSDYYPGNGFYSLAPLIPDPDLNEQFPYISYHAYMLKQADVYYSENLLNHTELKDAALAHLKLKKEQRKKLAKTRKTILQQMEDNIKLTDNKEVQSGCPDSICDFVVKWYKDNNKLPREFLMVSQAQYLLLKYSASYPTTLRNNMMKTMFKVEGTLPNCPERAYTGTFKMPGYDMQLSEAPKK